jgi:3-phenylpropionate/trans-cinnamate dioxygenase ferredoxin reductase component
MDSIVVVGGGLGAAHTCDRLRQRGFRGSITMLSDETLAPYDRPPLSKQPATTSDGPTSLPLDWSTLAVDLRLGHAVTDIRPEGDQWVVNGGSDAVTADAVVFATGARPRRLNGMERHGNALTLRTWSDATRIHESLSGRPRVVVIGASWIGAEVASTATHAGARVTVIDSAAAPLGAVTTGFPELGRAVGTWFSDAGIDLRLEVGSIDFDRESVLLDGTTRIDADIVVVGVGVLPNTEALAGVVDLDPQGAVLVDEHLSSSAPGLVAVGDCASYRSARYGRHVRPEHWTNALQGATTAAATLIGQDEPHDPVPYFWSQQFGRVVQYSGRHAHSHELLIKGDPMDERWTATWTDQKGRVSAALAVRSPKEFALLRRAIELPELVAGDLPR